MSAKSVTRPDRYWWRHVLLLLIVLSALPEIAVYVVTAIAKAKGCAVDQGSCLIGGVSLSGVLAKDLTAASWVGNLMGNFGGSIVWLTLCYLAIQFGWRSLGLRFLLAFIVTVALAVLFYWGPYLSIVPLLPSDCAAAASNAGPCKMFGEDIRDAVDSTVTMSSSLFWSGPIIAAATFAAYAIVAVVLYFRSVLHRIKSRHGQQIPRPDLRP